MTGAATAVALAGLAAVGVMIGVAYANRDVDAEDLPDSPRESMPVVVATFGALAGVVALVAVGGWVLGDLSVAAVGLGGPVLRSAAVGVATGAVIALGHAGLVRGLRAAGLSFSGQWSALAPGTPGELWWVVAGTTVQATAEEVLFRAALVGAGAAALGVTESLLVPVAAVLFGLAHVGRGAGSVVSTALAGVGFGLVFLAGGLVAAAAAHAANNTAGFIWSYHTSGADEGWRADRQ